MWLYDIGRSRFWKVPSYLSWLKKMVFDQNYDMDVVTKAYREENILLVLDDLGVENPTDWASEQLYLILDARYDAQLPTILTSNRPANHLDERLVSRFRSGLVIITEALDLR